MNYEETLSYIHNVKWQGSKPGLERTRELLKRLGNPERKLKFVHIAGTNGKGSTAACIASVLREAGYNTGLYTSPYVLRFNERMQINGEQITDGELCELAEKIRPYADAMADAPTEFELITALGMEYFAVNNCDIVVLEVGMGGELDSTNVIDTPEVAVITAIGLDHTKELGDTVPLIAMAKAGIIKKGGEVVIYGGTNGEEPVFEEVCSEKGATLHKTDFSKLRIKRTKLEGITLDFGELRDLFIPLAGTYQPYNTAVAITALEVLRSGGYNITDKNIRNGISKVYWPGRFEVLRKSPVFILEGAHNPHGIKASSESLKAHFEGQKIVFLVGVMADKDLSHMIEYLSPIAERFIAVRPQVPRAMAAEELAKRLSQTGVPSESFPTIESGVRRAISAAGADGAVCAIGTLYFSGEVREAVKKTT